MSNTTKLALGASLKKCLLHKPIDKITINELTADCGITRMSFYYHFKDIYDLVEWVCVEDGRKALQDKKTYDTWQEGALQIFEAVMENKPFILNVYRNVSRGKIESFLHKLTYNLISDVIEEKSTESKLDKEDKAFIAEFYKYAFVGVMLDWIAGGMKDDYKKIVEKMSITLHGTVAVSISNFEHMQRI